MVLSDLTLFLITCGEKTYSKSIRALENQTCTFNIDVIKNIFPMSAAFQTMPNRCKTKYFIQVDSDMILNEDTVEKLYNYINQSSKRTYLVSGQLYEKGFGLGGAIKCWKKSIFDHYSFRDVRTVDRDFYKQVRFWGYRRKHYNEVMGLHLPRESKFNDYVKVKSDIEKWRFLKRPYSKYALDLFDKVINNNPIKREKFFGLILGVISYGSRISRSKDLSYEKKIFLKYKNKFINKNTVEIINDTNMYEIRNLFIELYKDIKGKKVEQRVKLLQLLSNKFGNKIIDHKGYLSLINFIDQ